jgi:L-amino acid N-acyltransferase YncA
MKPPPIESFEQKIKSTDEFPFFVAAIEGDTVLGYAYVSEYRPLPGYRYTVEDTIFIHHDS